MELVEEFEALERELKKNPNTGIYYESVYYEGLNAYILLVQPISPEAERLVNMIETVGTDTFGVKTVRTLPGKSRTKTKEE